MIGIVDYGLGNILSFANIYKRLNISVQIASDKKGLTTSDRIIFPGIGSFDWAMTQLNRSGLREILDSMVLEKRIPVLGVCVGLQMMANRSEEGKLEGLQWIDAEVKHFPDQVPHLPHMGWNDVTPISEHPLFSGLESDARFYFLHSYYFSHGCDAQVLAESDYYGTFTCSAHNNNVFGVQFHPEKSHHWGVRLLKNFAEMELC